jgi:hypothetical protein
MRKGRILRESSADALAQGVRQFLSHLFWNLRLVVWSKILDYNLLEFNLHPD